MRISKSKCCRHRNLLQSLNIVKRKSSQEKVKRKPRKKKEDLTLLTLLSLLHTTTTTTINFSGTSRGPTIKCYTFLETSHDPRLGSQLRCKYFANFFATPFCKLFLRSLLKVLLQGVPILLLQK